MFSRVLTKVFAGLFFIVVVGCDNTSNPSSVDGNSPVGVWYYDTTASTMLGNTSTSFLFDVKQSGTYALNMVTSAGFITIKMDDSGTWVQSGSNLIKTSTAVWVTNPLTAQYEKISTVPVIDTIPIDIKNDQWNVNSDNLSGSSQSQTIALKRK